MDKIAQSANSSRSKRGTGFEAIIVSILNDLLLKKKIKSFEEKPKIFSGEFNPDFLVVKNNSKVVSIDSTTTARTDRLRGKQWDAYGTKLYYKKKKKLKITSLVVVQDSATTKMEKDNFRRCKNRVKLPHSALDEVVSVDELKKVLTN